MTCVSCQTCVAWRACTGRPCAVCRWCREERETVAVVAPPKPMPTNLFHCLTCGGHGHNSHNCPRRKR